MISGKTELRARIGPTGGKRGYTAITGCTFSTTVIFKHFFFYKIALVSVSVMVGQPSWGIAWYINDLLIPEIYVERGETYTFLVEGGTEL